MASQDNAILAGRGAMTVTGTIAGFAAWAMVEVLPDLVQNPHLFITLVAAVGGFFTVLLAISGPTPLGRSALGAAVLAVAGAVLLGLASTGFHSSEDFLNSGFPVIAWILFLCLGTPFVAVWVWDRQYWNSYLDLFDFSWSIVVRFTAAWLFVGVFWLVLFLSDALLSLVSIHWIEWLIELEPMPYILIGAVFGLALRVVWEMREYLSPYMLLHLLRLLLPVLLVVMVIFVLALPFSDPETLFAGLSPAGTMMAVAIGAISLVSVALDKSDADAVHAAWMQWAVRGVALLLPVLAGLAIWGVWLRVAQYGWTPDRLAAMSAAVIVMAYALLYFLSVLRGGDWMARIRQGNMILASVVLGVCVLWLIPFVSAETISARSQAARYVNGQVDAHEAALWEMAHEWGKAGQQALDRLAGLPEADHPDLHRALALVATTDSPYAFGERLGNPEWEALPKRLIAAVHMVPQGSVLPLDAVTTLADFRLKDWVQTCERDHQPGCVLLQGDFDTRNENQEGVMFLPATGGEYEALSVWIDADGDLVVGGYLRDPAYGGSVRLQPEDVQRVLDGDFRIGPSSRNALWLGDRELNPEN